MNETALSDVWLAGGVGAFVLAVIVVTIFAVRERRPPVSTDQKLDALASRMGQLEEKQKAADHDLRNVRAIVGNLPTKDSISRIGEEVAKSRGEITGMQGVLQSQSRSLDRIEDFLMRASVDHIVGKPRDYGDGEPR